MVSDPQSGDLAKRGLHRLGKPVEFEPDDDLLLAGHEQEPYQHGARVDDEIEKVFAFVAFLPSNQFFAARSFAPTAAAAAFTAERLPP
jgi:hypothetical protein